MGNEGKSHRSGSVSMEGNTAFISRSCSCGWITVNCRLNVENSSKLNLKIFMRGTDFTTDINESAAVISESHDVA